ncbi:MAG TPA: bifunctional diaminohydroxyphosphoribosylaminopyrimidine deaminase/5-amino-6-(5-phosphoribosylamino)uracil reductase RibD, partial [Dehalococcoidia bacterium]|nr:bifunctional diaminohydroxyphosphoribosylaminopyrimidine deaminase/5-amino-6-(5-phosphoribosylamino)uracil reductase RibD [Dehalococcoidia bacterium]
FYGRTPPCTKAIINAGIAEVHFPMIDPNPLVSGRGMSELEEAGIKTYFGEHKEEALEINESYIKFTARGLPFVIAKFAMSLDGKVATKTGDAKWISSEESRRYVHCLRHRVDAIMVGVNTIITDDPQLTARAGKDGGRTEKQPLRVVVDSRGRTPLNARVFQVPGKILVAVTEEIEPAKSRALTEAGAEVLPLPLKEGMVDLGKLLRALGSKGIVNLLAEGGPTLFGSLFEQGLVDRLLTFISPLIIGGREASSPVKGIGVEKVTQAMLLNRVRVERFGDDVLISAYVKKD